MRNRLMHRGPDGVGVHAKGAVALGHTRLSIIDVAGGDQPLCNEDASVWVAFNGEIYNYRQLRSELAGLGHLFRTQSDTEVLVHAYEEWGDEFVSRLNGMFGFAIHDVARGRLFLARDQLGIKPVFYEQTCEGLFFGSEVKAVLAGSGAASEPDPTAVHEYLMFRYAAWDRTFYRTVRRLPPGHYAVWERGRLQVERYWAPPTTRSEHLSLDDAVEELDSLLRSAVRMQLMSEVPLGVFCSGGVDSGLVTCLAAEETDSPLHSFSVGFEDASWDESPLACDTAARAGTVHHVVACHGEMVGRSVPSLLWYNDEPLSHPNSVPLAALSRFARERVTVVLTGEGPDEYLSGYPRHHLAGIRGALDWLPAWATKILARSVGLFPARRARLAAQLTAMPVIDSMVANSQYVSAQDAALLTGSVMDDALVTRRALAAAATIPGDGIASINRYDVLTYLQCALDRMDRMSMASGLEARVPFLDIRLVEWGLKLPSRLKTGGLSNKRVLKALAKRHLSHRIVRGRKSGFGLPLDDWFRGAELAPLLTPLDEPDHPAAVHFDAGRMNRILGDHRDGTANHGELLWLIANVYQWYELQVVSGGAFPEPIAVPAASSGTRSGSC